MMLERRVVVKKRSRTRDHIHLKTTVVPSGPLLEGGRALDSMNNITTLEGLDQKALEECLMGMVLQPSLHTAEGVVSGRQLGASR